MKSLLVIGMGYLGNAVADRAQERNWNVVRASLHPSSGVLQADLGSLTSIGNLTRLVAPPDVIIHTASSNHGNEEVYEKVFVKGVRHLKSVFPEARLIFSSSTSVYENKDGSPVTEEMTLSPHHGTSAILKEAEDIVLSDGGIVARLSHLYGPGRSVLLARMLENSAVMEGNSGRYLNHIHRDDAASAYMILADSPEAGGQIYNVSDDMPMQQKKIYKALSALLDVPMPEESDISISRKRAWTNKKVVNSKLRSLGWNPGYPSFLEAVPDLLPTLPEYEIRWEDEE